MKLSGRLDLCVLLVKAITSPIFVSMFTANLAGSAGSHLRPDRGEGGGPYGHRDSNTHSRMNLHEIDQLGSDEEAIKRLQAAHNKDGNTERIEVDPERMQARFWRANFGCSTNICY